MVDGYYNLSGGWLGTYRYLGIVPIRFEATFRQKDRGFNGEIIDEVFPGLANVDGGQRGSDLFFTKTYVVPLAPNQINELEYRGSISEDGKTIRGTWRGKAHITFLNWLPVTGDWEAHRMWAEDENAALDSNSASSNAEFATVNSRA